MCVWVCTCVYMWVCVCVYACMGMYMCIYVSVYVCVYVCKCVCIYVCICVCVGMLICICVFDIWSFWVHIYILNHSYKEYWSFWLNIVVSFSTSFENIDNLVQAWMMMTITIVCGFVKLSVWRYLADLEESDRWNKYESIGLS